MAARMTGGGGEQRGSGNSNTKACPPLASLALAYGEAVIAALGESGLSSRDAAWAADTLTYYVVGHTIEEQLAVALPGSGHDATARLTGAVDPQRHPHMYAALAHIPAPHHQEPSTTVSTSLSTASGPTPRDRD